MPVHDWSIVEAGIFHDFHVGWIPEIRGALNSGLLPEGYYAMAEQHAAGTIADVLTLHASPPPTTEPLPLPPATGGALLAEAPPRTRSRQTIESVGVARRRSIAIRHISGHRLVALLEVVSPANKDRRQSVLDFADKVAEALDRGVHVLVVDLFAPGPHDPYGMHGAIRQRLAQEDEPFDDPADRPPPDEPLTLVAYAATRPKIEVFREQVAVGARLPPMPLFLRPDRYVEVPLEETYQKAYAGLPAFWKDVLEGTLPK